MKTSVIAYVPALHQGYLNFFKKNPGILYLLGDDLKLNYPRMERDIRALSAEDIKKALQPFDLYEKIEILDKHNLLLFIDKVQNLIMPDEDIMRDFADKYLGNKKVNFVSVFLRWDRHSAQKDNLLVNPDRLISTNEFDQEIMNKAFQEAEKSSDWWRQIGTIVVREGKIILVGHNKPLPSEGVHNIFGDPRSNFDYGVSFELSKFLHAEAGVIAEAARRGITLEGTFVYVTTFPCPVCAKLIAMAGVKKIYYSEGYSLLDAEDILKSFGVEIIQVKID